MSYNMENIRKDISQIKETIGRLDERTKGLPTILISLTNKTSSLKTTVKFHFWIMGVTLIIIGAIAQHVYL